MNAPETKIALPAIGAPFAGGFFIGVLEVGGTRFAQICAPKAEGLAKPATWNESWKAIEGAMSHHDGLANTEAMAAAGSELARWARAQTIGGFSDWAIPAIDQLELRYRIGKPTTRPNACWYRSGINISACPPTPPYTPEFPAQSEIAIFREGGAEALEEEWYWTSTQYAGGSDCAWVQLFGYGGQDGVLKSRSYPAVLVRSQII